jgi:hypothetical protein
MHCPTTSWKTSVYVKSGNVQKAAADGLFVWPVASQVRPAIPYFFQTHYVIMYLS